MKTFLSGLLAIGMIHAGAQTIVNGFSFDEDTGVPVFHNNQQLTNPWAGGLNYPHVGNIDLNNDGTEDLLVFDKTGRRVIPFVNTASAGIATYEYAPEYRHAFPRGEGYYLLRDFNCDGKKDIFTGILNGNMIVYENISSGGTLAFKKAHSTPYLEASFVSGNSGPIGVLGSDIPGIIDVDNDGDLDILTFFFAQNNVGWIENVQNCGLQFQYNEKCWGHFVEAGLSNDILLDTCPPVKLKKGKGLHSGSNLLPLDLNGDGVKEVLISDISFTNAIALFNNGTADSAFMFSKDTLFPNYDQPIAIDDFPAMFFEDVDGDQIKDLIATPNEYDNNTGLISGNNVWVYKNKGTNSNPVFELTETNFLRKTQLDVGEGCIPRLADLNGDGLLDIVASNAYYRNTKNAQVPALLYLQNTGTAQNPEYTVIDTNFLNVSSYNLGLALTPAFGDLDNDNDLDMILGDGNGQLHYFTNNGSPQSPAFTLTTPGLGGYNLSGGATPFLFDFDQDGDMDMIVGGSNGKLSYFENQSATSPSFTLITSYFGGVNVTSVASGFSVPYAFEQDGHINLMVSSEAGVFQFDSIASGVSQPSSLEGTFADQSIESSTTEETPFGTSKRSGRSRFLYHASELKAAGLNYGRITELAFNIVDARNCWFQNGMTIRLQNVSSNDVNDFNAPMVTCMSDKFQKFSTGWNSVPLTKDFLWDGTSNLLIEVCFSSYLTGNNYPECTVEMSATPFFSNAYGDVTNFNKLDSKGCEMPYLNSIKKRPNLKIKTIPAFRQTSTVMSDGYRNAAAFGDIDQDGFVDAILGNFSGGMTYYKGRQYNISTPEERTLHSRFQVYPNPGRGRFAVVTQNTGSAALNIFDITGKSIRTIELQASETLVDLQEEPNGIYLFILQDGTTIKTQKIILQR